MAIVIPREALKVCRYINGTDYIGADPPSKESHRLLLEETLNCEQNKHMGCVEQNRHCRSFTFVRMSNGRIEIRQNPVHFCAVIDEVFLEI